MTESVIEIETEELEVSAETWIKIYDLYNTAVVITGNNVASARSAKRVKRETYVKSNDQKRDEFYKRTVARHRGKRDSVMGMNRLTGTGC